MARDYLKREIKPGGHVFYHGGLYRVTQTNNSQVWLQYAVGYQLKQPKRRYGSECLWVPEQDVVMYLLRNQQGVDNVVA
jgi:hypothetical protein